MIKFNVQDYLQEADVNLVRKIQQNISNNVSICAFNLRTSGNIGAIIRTSCLLGFKEVIICGRKVYNKTFTVGAENYIDVRYINKPLTVKIDTVSPGVFSETVEYHPDLFVEEFSNYTPVFLEQGGTDIREVSFKTIKNPLVIVGNEGSGIPKDFIDKIKKNIPETIVVSIPQWSVMRSMNVCTALTIALWEIRRK
jgi:tRNA G18 (ribose-2'-O)-methylase SpoU